MQPNLVRLVNDINDALVVAFIGHKIEPVGVYQQNAHIVLLLTQEIKITLLDILQIGVANFLFIAAPTLANVALQTSHIGIKIH